MTTVGRAMTTPGVSAGTRIIVPRRWLSASGSLIAKTIPNVAPSAPLENHLPPSITQSSPSRTARVRRSVGSDPATSGSVIEKNERARPATSGSRKRSRLLRRPELVQDLGVAGVGRLAAEDELCPVRAPDLLVQAGVVEEPLPRPAGLRRHVRRPQARLPRPLLQLGHQLRRGVVLTVERAFVREDVLLHELPVAGPPLEVGGREERLTSRQ